MKILWFTNTPANADEYLNTKLKGTGGWIKALDQELQNHVALHVAFYHDHDQPFTYLNTMYHPIKSNESLMKKVLRKFGFSIVKNGADLKQYLRIIDEVKPDIIHIHGTENTFGCICGQTQIPVVISLQGIISVVEHKYFSGFDKSFLKVRGQQSTRFIDFLFSYRFSKEFALFNKMKTRERTNLQNTRFVIGRTDWDRRVSRILAPKSIYYHNDETLRDSFYSNYWKRPEGNNLFIIHTTSGNHFYKGFETLCHALSLLNEIGFNCEWRVAGVDNKDLIHKLARRKLKKIFPGQGLVLLGKLDEKALIERMLEAHIYVMPSNIENSPNNLCEAMMLGMPCISTFAGGTSSLTTDKVTGLLIQSGDPWAMAGAIIELAAHREEAIRMGLNARNVALKRHDKETIVSGLTSIYEKLVHLNTEEEHQDQ